MEVSADDKKSPLDSADDESKVKEDVLVGGLEKWKKAVFVLAFSRLQQQPLEEVNPYHHDLGVLTLPYVCKDNV